MKVTNYVIVITLIFFTTCSIAAVRDAGGNAKIVAKLQAMVRQATAERDQIKTELAKLTGELEAAKKATSKAVTASDKLNKKLSRQQSSNKTISKRLELTHAKLLEVIDKYKALNQSKHELKAQHVGLQDLQQGTLEELKSCEGKNVKMYEAASDLLENYENKGVLTQLLQGEPLLQFKSVEIENIVQDYEDKLRDQQYSRTLKLGENTVNQ